MGVSSKEQVLSSFCSYLWYVTMHRIGFVHFPIFPRRQLEITCRASYTYLICTIFLYIVQPYFCPSSFIASISRAAVRGASSLYYHHSHYCYYVLSAAVLLDVVTAADTKTLYSNTFYTTDTCKATISVTKSTTAMTNAMYKPLSSGLNLILFSPSQSEMMSYEMLVDTVTRASPSLAIGISKGIPSFASWANSTARLWQVPALHLRHNRHLCAHATIRSTQGNVVLYKELKAQSMLSYLFFTRQAIIHPKGILIKKCGYLQLSEGCETHFRRIGRVWLDQCRKNFSSGTNWKSLWKSIPTLQDACQIDLPDEEGLKRNVTVDDLMFLRNDTKATFFVENVPYAHYKRVFVIASGWDHNYHHFIVESLTRLIRHLDFLLKNPDIKIHIRNRDNTGDDGRGILRRLFELVGIDFNRVVSGLVYADIVFLPSTPRCTSAMYQPYELRLLARLLMKNAAIAGVADAGGVADLDGMRMDVKKRNIVVLRRPCQVSNDTEPYFCNDWRDWDTTTAMFLAQNISSFFPSHNVMLLSADDPYFSDCLPCQIRLFSHTDILVGTHGAGLTNIMFMNAGSLLFEIVGQFDGRMLPVCGFHGPLAAVFGIHHYIYYYDGFRGIPVDPNDATNITWVPAYVDVAKITQELYHFYQERLL